MKYKRIVAFATAGVAAMALLVANPAGAQEPPALPLDVDPTSGPIGTVITVSGDDCFGEAVFTLLEGTSLEDVTGILVENFVDANGSWTGELVVPDTVLLFEDFSEADVVPGEDYFVTAFCNLFPVPGEGDELLDDAAALAALTENGDGENGDHEPAVLFYENVDFEVTEEPAPPTPAPPAEPAVPVEEEPTFTG
jgi:hypothetical protein